MDNHTSYLEKEKTWKLLIKFALPCVLSLLISALYNIVDQIFIGNSNVGTIGNTATTIVFPLTCIMLAFALCIGDGCAALMSLSYGKKDFKKPVKAVGNTITIALIFSILSVSICLPLISKIVVLFGASSDIAIEKSVEYGSIIVMGFPFFIIGTSLGSIIRADGNPKGAMIAMVSGALTNIVLDALFIFGFDMGLKGAALATIIGQILTALISIVCIIKSKTFKLKFESFKLDLSCIGQILKLGLSSFLTQISIVIISVVSMNMLAKYGSTSKYGSDDPQAIVGVSMKVFSIAVNIAVGIAVGAQPIVGYNYGAQKFNRVKETFKYMMLSITVVGIISTILFQVIPDKIIGIFGSNTANPELYKEFGIMTIRIYLSLILFTLLQKASSIYLQSIGSPFKAMILSLTRDVIIFVPATILIPFMMNDIKGVLIAAPVADVIGFALSIIFIFIEFKKINEKQLKVLSEAE